MYQRCNGEYLLLSEGFTAYFWKHIGISSIRCPGGGGLPTRLCQLPWNCMGKDTLQGLNGTLSPGLFDRLGM